MAVFVVFEIEFEDVEFMNTRFQYRGRVTSPVLAIDVLASAPQVRAFEPQDTVPDEVIEVDDRGPMPNELVPDETGIKH
jgi:hypothetical protein